MFKASLKLLVIFVAVTGFALFLSSGQKVAAATGCPSGTGTPTDWGFHKGEVQDGYAGLIVYSSIGKRTDGSSPPGQGNPVNTDYRLYSGLPAPYPVNGRDTHYQPLPPGTQYTQDARIFEFQPGSNPPNTISRNNQVLFRTGETIHAGSASFNCGGWSAIGPGYTDEAGNYHGMDCGEWLYYNGTSEKATRVPTDFWISNVPNYGGQSGRWELLVNGVHKRDDINNSSPYKFNVGNGESTRIDLVWHQDPPNSPNSSVNGVCTYLQVVEGGGYSNEGGAHAARSHVTAGNLSVGKIDGTVQNPRQSGINGYAPKEDNTDGASGTKTWYFFPSGSNDLDITVTRQWYKDDNPNKGWHDIPDSTYHITKDCFIASCTIHDVFGDGPGGIVLANGNIYATVTMTNNSADGLPMVNPVVRGSDGIVRGSDDNVAAGGTHDFPVTIRAPGWRTTPYPFNFRPEYNVSTENMSTCSGQAALYQYFRIDPRTSIVDTSAENPTVVKYKTGGDLKTGPVVTTNTHSTLTKQNAGSAAVNTVDTHDNTDTYGSITHDFSYNNAVINAGDQFCSHVTINPASAYRGPTGYPDVNPVSATADSASCLKTVNEPYAHFVGSDVSAGGGFGQNCPATQKGNIYAFSNSAGPGSSQGGAGSQFGAEAFNVISGLSSASLRGSFPTGVGGLTFANDDSHIGGSTPNRTNGGFLGGAGNFCVPDYFGDKPSSLATPDTNASASAGTAGADKQYHKPAGGTLTLNGGTITSGMNQAIFVDGNVIISGNIKYAGGRSSIKDIQSFYLVVKNGNIRIAPGVTQLDGVYVAQPDTTSASTISKTGIINTCWSAAFTTPNTLYNSCKQQLVVNGAFVANKVLLGRSYSSLRYSQNGEHNLGGYAAHNCGNSGKDVPAGATSNADCAAEIFNFSPELYLSQPAINNRFGPSTGKLDAITSLSPVL